jgi:Transcriptional regulator, AbiEi antitoxin
MSLTERSGRNLLQRHLTAGFMEVDHSQEADTAETCVGLLRMVGAQICSPASSGCGIVINFYGPRRWIRRLHGTYHRVTLSSMSGLTDLPATFTTGEAVAHGVHPRDLYAARDSGAIIELSRGVFRNADVSLATYPDFLAVAHRAPRAIVCLVSAAAVHELTDEIPTAVQIAVPKPSRPPHITFPPTKVFRFDPETFELGLSSVEAAPGELIRIYDPPRTVIDLMRLRHRFGEPVALGALRRYLRRGDAQPAALLRMAAALDVHGPVRLAVDIARAG